MRNGDSCWSEMPGLPVSYGDGIRGAWLVLLVWLCGGFSAEEFCVRAEEPSGSWNERATRANWWRTPRDYNTKYHPWLPPGSLEEWDQMAPQLREQLLIAQGLWPIPERSPLKPVIHGKLDCGDYTIEKVFFASRPGLYVTGNLYRPVGFSGPRPGVLSPHGHWPEGRFYEANAKQVEADLASGAEPFEVSARSPLQARMVHLARMGCVVFHYDMIGYADNTFLHHTADFVTAEDGLWLLESMGLQTWNSWRALDFISELEDVDPDQIVMTGASGGGTQTFVLSALDERIKLAVPAVMVSTDMQGGCICENAPFLRLGMNNVAVAALMAPRPLGLTGANDWTLRIQTRGFPELRQVYGLYNQPDRVQVWVHPEFGHNYNAVSRKYMYGWIASQLPLEQADLSEREFERKTPEELTVFTAEYPRPADALDAAGLRREWITQARADLAHWETAAGTEDYERIVGAAARVLLGGDPPQSEQILLAAAETDAVESQSSACENYLVAHRETGTVIPLVVRRPDSSNSAATQEAWALWFSDQGSALLTDPAHPLADSVRVLLDRGITVAAADLRGCGVNRPGSSQPVLKVNQQYYGYTHGYIAPPLTNQTQDLRAVVVAVLREWQPQSMQLIGTAGLGPAVLLGQSGLGEIIQAVHVELPHGLSHVQDIQDPLFLPGAARYGGLGGLAGLAPAPKIRVHQAADSVREELKLLQTRCPQLEFVETPLTFE